MNRKKLLSGLLILAMISCANTPKDENEKGTANLPEKNTMEEPGVRPEPEKTGLNGPEGSFKHQLAKGAEWIDQGDSHKQKFDAARRKGNKDMNSWNAASKAYAKARMILYLLQDKYPDENDLDNIIRRLNERVHDLYKQKPVEW